jgi:putative transcription factor
MHLLRSQHSGEGLKVCCLDLWQQINEKPQVIQEYESGKAIPNNQIITKLERVLGVKLRGGKK